MKVEKKEKLAASQRYNEILNRNKKISRINILILATGLLLSFTNYIDIASFIILVGVAIFAYTMSTNIVIWWRRR